MKYRVSSRLTNARSSVTLVQVVPRLWTSTVLDRAGPPPKSSSSATKPRLAEWPQCLLCPVNVTAGFPSSTLRSDSRLCTSDGEDGWGSKMTLLRHELARAATSALGSLRIWCTRSRTCSSGRVLMDVMMESTVSASPVFGAAAAETSRLVPAEAAHDDLDRRLSLSAS